MVLKWLRRLVRGKKKKNKATKDTEIAVPSSEPQSDSICSELNSTEPLAVTEEVAQEKKDDEKEACEAPMINSTPQGCKKVQFHKQILSPGITRTHGSPGSQKDDTPLKSCLKRTETEPAIRSILKAPKSVHHSKSDINMLKNNNGDDDDIFDDNSSLRDMLESGTAQGSIVLMQAQQQMLHRKRISTGRGHRLSENTDLRSISRYGSDPIIGNDAENVSERGQYTTSLPFAGASTHYGWHRDDNYPPYPPQPLHIYGWNTQIEFPYTPTPYDEDPGIAAGPHYYDRSMHDLYDRQMQVPPPYYSDMVVDNFEHGLPEDNEFYNQQASSIPFSADGDVVKHHRRKDSLEMQRNLRKKGMNEQKFSADPIVDNINSSVDDAVAMQPTGIEDPDANDKSFEQSMTDSTNESGAQGVENSLDIEDLNENDHANVSADMESYTFPDSSTDSVVKLGADKIELHDNPLRKSSSENMTEDSQRGITLSDVPSSTKSSSNPEDTSSSAATGEDDADNTDLKGESMEDHTGGDVDTELAPSLPVEWESSDYGPIVSSSYEEFTNEEDYKEIERLVGDGFTWNQANDMVSLQRRLKREEEENERLRRELHRKERKCESRGQQGQHYFQTFSSRTPVGHQHNKYYPNAVHRSRSHGYSAGEERPGAYHGTGPLEDKYFKTLQSPAVVVSTMSDSFDFASQNGSGRHHRSKDRSDRNGKRSADLNAGKLGERGMVRNEEITRFGHPMHANSEYFEPHYSEHKKSMVKPYHSEYAMKEAAANYDAPIALSRVMEQYPPRRDHHNRNNSKLSVSSRDMYGSQYGEQYFATKALPVPHAHYSYTPPTAGRQMDVYSHHGGGVTKRDHYGVHMKSHPKQYDGRYRTAVVGASRHGTRPFFFSRNNEAVQLLMKMNMGVSELDVVYALRMCRNDTEAAANYLMDQSHLVR